MTRFQGKLDSEFELFLTIPGVVHSLFKFHAQATACLTAGRLRQL
jgi:hypothetical protein